MSRAFGIDLSPRSTHSYAYQDNHDFVMVGVSDGMVVLDSAHLLESAQQAPVTIAYHYARNNVKPADQVQTYLAAIEGFEVDVNVLDFESEHNNHEEGRFALEAKFWIDEIKEATGKHTLFYSRKNLIEDWVLAFGVDFITRVEYELWYARYPWVTWNQDFADDVIAGNIDPGRPAGVSSWRFWQFSADGNQQGSNHGVTSTDVDLDVFNGTKEELLAWCAPRVDEPDTQAEKNRRAIAQLQSDIESHAQRIQATREDIIDLKSALRIANKNIEGILSTVGDNERGIAFLGEIYDKLEEDLTEVEDQQREINLEAQSFFEGYDAKGIEDKVASLWILHKDEVEEQSRNIWRKIKHNLGLD